MGTVRRWYLFLVATISLQAVTWALIALLRTILGVWGAPSTEAIAFQVAVIVIGLPVYLIHWLWAQRLAAADADERADPLRRLYLYGTMAALLIPAISNAFDLSSGLLGLLLDPGSPWHGGYPFGPARSVTQGVFAHLTPILVLGLLWLYHRQIAAADAATAPLTGNSALIRRLYLLGFSLGGLILVAQWAVAALRWVLYQFGGPATTGAAGLIDPLAGLVVGLPLWVLAWRLAQHHFFGPDIAERESALRKFYLHAVIFFSALAAVSGATLMLAGLLRQALGLSPQGDLRGPLPVILVAAVVWAYHSQILRADTALIAEAPRQAGVRRLSWYLVASIGLATTVIGLGFIVSVLIRALGAPSFGDDLREQLAWSLAALIAGFPVWALVWRRAQRLAERDGPGGDDERGSLARRIYLYGFLFAATLTILSGLVYIVFRLLRLALGEPAEGNLVADLAQAIAFSALAAGVLLYHGRILRAEGRRRQTAVTKRAAELRVAVLDLDDGVFGQAVTERLRHDVPGLTLQPIGLTPAAAARMGAAPDPRGLAAQLAEAGLIVGPWQVAVGQTAGVEVAQAVGASPAHKLLVPRPAEQWSWAGVEPWNTESALTQVVHAVRQTLNGEPVRPVRALAPLALVGTIVGVVLLLILTLIVATAVMSFV
jgi:hypothetical protein